MRFVENVELEAGGLVGAILLNEQGEEYRVESVGVLVEQHEIVVTLQACDDAENVRGYPWDSLHNWQIQLPNHRPHQPIVEPHENAE